MKVAFGILIGIVVIGLALVSVFQASGPKAVNNSALQIGEVRGDRLGMDFKDYQKLHPGDCDSGGASACTSSLGRTTYAGASAIKSMTFTSDGKLAQIDYVADANDASTILGALKEKYGDNGCTTSTKLCSWTNGKAKVQYSNGEKAVSLTFVDQALMDQWSREYQQKKASERKTDQ
ncbi:MAG TPA: hypothetical protein VF532_25080 [Candidatus Angelobacter sp.]